MIDFSNEIFNGVSVHLRSLYPEIRLVGEYEATPSSFPTVTMDETQNIPTHLDTARSNRYAEVVYRVQVFTNSKSGKRSQARSIYGIVDEKMQEMGFMAESYTTTPAIYNSEVYCITATYRGVVDREGVIYRG